MIHRRHPMVASCLEEPSSSAHVKSATHAEAVVSVASQLRPWVRSAPPENPNREAIQVAARGGITGYSATPPVSLVQNGGAREGVGSYTETTSPCCSGSSVEALVQDDGWTVWR